MTYLEAAAITIGSLIVVLTVAWHVIGWLLRRDLARYETRQAWRDRG